MIRTVPLYASASWVLKFRKGDKNTSRTPSKRIFSTIIFNVLTKHYTPPKTGGRGKQSTCGSFVTGTKCGSNCTRGYRNMIQGSIMNLFQLVFLILSMNITYNHL